MARSRPRLRVCAGIKHAHEKGILHLDLKPSNVLVTRVTDDEVVKVIDFGIARALDEPLLEESQQTQELILGSPPYISPEAMTLAGRWNLDTRTDVYSLGLILYQLLAGVLPFEPKGQTIWSLLRHLEETESLAPSKRLAELDGNRVRDIAALRRTTPRRLARRLAGDLDAIIVTAIDRDPERRYSTLAELAADLERHLKHRLVAARDRSLPYRFKVFIRRNVGSVIATGLVLAAMAAGLVARTVEARRANAEAERAMLALEESEQVRELMIGLFEGADPERTAGKALTVRDLLDQGADRLRVELAQRPLVRAKFLHLIGSIYTKLGELQSASDVLTEALDVRRQHQPDGHPEILESESELGVIYRRQGHFAEAEPLLLSVLAARQNDPDYGPELLARAHSNLGNLHWSQRRYEEAEASHRAALDLRQRNATLRQDPEGWTDLALSVNNLGVMLDSRGRDAEARPLMLRAIELFRRVEHPHLAAALNNLGLVERSLETWERAEPLFREALAIWEATYGTDHQRPVLARRNIVSELELRHRRDEALADAGVVVEIAERIGDPAALVAAVRSLGGTRQRAGRADAAAETYRRCIALSEVELGSDHRTTTDCRVRLASAIGQTGDVDAAMAMLREIAAGQDRTPCLPSSARLRTERNMGSLMFRVGRHAEAEAHHRRNLEAQERRHEASHPTVLSGHHLVGECVAAQGRFDEAVEHLERALEGRREQLGDAPLVASSMHELAVAEEGRGNRSRARELLEQAVAIRRAVYPPGDDDLRDSTEALAGIAS